MAVPVQCAWYFHLKCSRNVKQINCKFCTSVQTPESRFMKERGGRLLLFWYFFAYTPSQGHSNPVLIYQEYRTAAKCPGSRQTGRRLTAEGSDRLRFSSPGDSRTETFISKPTLGLAFVADKGKALWNENLLGSEVSIKLSPCFSLLPGVCLKPVQPTLPQNGHTCPNSNTTERP